MRLVLIGLAAGVFSALFGVGGGILIVPLLILATELPDRCAAGTSLAAIGVTALAGTILYAIEGSVDIDIGYAALVGLPAAVGAVAGTTIQQRLPVRSLSLGFAAVLAGVAIWLLVS